jgi:hypothetical protein
MAGASSWSSMVQGNVDAPYPYSQTLEIYGSESCKEWLCGGVNDYRPLTVLYKPGSSGIVSINYFSPMDVHSIVVL